MLMGSCALCAEPRDICRPAIPPNMRRVILFIATSVDGFIARENGSYDWLPSDDNDYGYRAFYKTIDTILLGRKTYEQVLAFPKFPYADKRCVVFSRKPKSLKEDPRRPPTVEVVGSDPAAFVRRLRRQRGAAIWLGGGASLIQPLQEARLIDEYVISVCPVLIGSGIPLFLKTRPQVDLKLTHRRIYRSGVVQLTYVPVRRKRAR